MKEQVAIQRILQSRLTTLRAKNPSYSIRAFSRKVGISAGTLSLVMLGKRKASKKLADKIAKNLFLDPQERAEILDQFPLKKIRTAQATDAVDPSYLQLTADQFHIVGDWYYFAILNLISTRGFKSKPSWIGKRLGLSESLIQDSLDRLKRLEMIQEDADGNISRVASRYRTTDDIASVSLRKSHHQTLDLAKESLESQSIELRDFTWVTLPLDTKKLGLAKTLIRKFQDDLIETLAQEAECNEVYRMAIQLFPLTKTTGEN